MNAVKESVTYALLSRFFRLLASGVLGGLWLGLTRGVTSAVRKRLISMSEALLVHHVEWEMRLKQRLTIAILILSLK